MFKRVVSYNWDTVHKNLWCGCQFGYQRLKCLLLLKHPFLIVPSLNIVLTWCSQLYQCQNWSTLAKILKLWNMEHWCYAACMRWVFITCNESDCPGLDCDLNLASICGFKIFLFFSANLILTGPGPYKPDQNVRLAWVSGELWQVF